MTQKSRPIREAILIISAVTFFICACVDSWLIAAAGVAFFAFGALINPEAREA